MYSSIGTANNPFQLRAQAEIKRRLRLATNDVPTPPADWHEWLPTLFPTVFNRPFAARHSELWRWVESVEPGTKLPALFAIWGRGGAKTTSAEAAAVRLGAKRARKFCLYVRGTQDKSNESTQNIAAMLEAATFGRYYPDMASRKLGKYGNAKGWRVDMLRCANGYSVAGLGLDAAVRGIKIEDARPDLIILDDIDDIRDSPETVQKKIDILTTSILPAGSVDVVVIGIQNLIHPNSIFSRICDGRAEFLLDRVISGPYPAVDGLTYEKQNGRYVITAGTATWEGQPLGVCQSQINEWGLTAFLREAQHEVDDPPGGMFNHLEYEHIEWDALPDLIKTVVWVDPAVTSTEDSDCMGIQADGLGADSIIYRLYSWEDRTSPEDALRRAILKAVELKASSVGVETNQGGDLWKSTYARVWDDCVQSDEYLHIIGEAEAERRNKDLETYPPPDGQPRWTATKRPSFRHAKADASTGGKAHRASLMLTDYERGRVKHVVGTHRVLERALNRFPLSKPFDLVDAGYWSWDELNKARRGSRIL